MGCVSEGLIHTAQLLGVQDSLLTSACLLGMAEAVIPDIHKEPDSFIRIETEGFIETARVTLGDKAYTAT